MRKFQLGDIVIRKGVKGRVISTPDKPEPCFINWTSHYIICMDEPFQGTYLWMSYLMDQFELA